jgi:PKD repeat protein
MNRSFGSTRLARAVALVSAVTLVMAGVALADNLQNNATSAGNNVITAGGSTTITYRLVANSSPGGDIGGCNVDDSNPATLTVTAPAAVTANPTSLQFTACGDGGAKTVVFSSNTPGSYTITHAISGGVSGALYNNQANFTLTVNPAGTTNSAPVIQSAAFAASVACRVSATLNVSFTDADADDTHTATIDWGDGSAVENLSPVTSPFSAPHTYTSPGTYTAEVTVTDGTDSVSETANITVNQTYTVAFLSPLNGSAPAKLIGNTFKNGRVVPVKATIYDDCALSAITGASGVTPTVKLNTSALPGGTDTDALEEYADAGQSSGNTPSMRWTEDGFWIYNLDSKTLGLKTNQNYRLNIFVGSVQATVANWVILSPTK